MNNRVFLLTCFILIISASSVSAQSMLVSNSRDWRDVYSVELFGNLVGIDSMFLTGTKHATIIHFSLPNSGVEIISSVDNPFVVGFDAILQSRGIADVEELSYDNVNLELARRLTDVSKFVIIDDSYGYNALAVAPFASMAGYYVLFADERNIGNVLDYLSEQTIDDMIIYGNVDRDVRSELAVYNPEIINLGDRFDNNIEIVKKYLELRPTKQTILSNGEFIEQSLLDGFDPVLFIGRTNVPDQIAEFIQQSDIDIGILVGNELIGTATIIRRQVGISVFVKFAQGARTPGGAISPVEDLDKFPMPKYELDFRIFSVFYNRATGFLEVTYRNNAELATYFKSTINIFSGEQLQIVGDEEPIFIDGEEFKTILFELDALQEENATAEFFTIFGESKKSLEFALEGTFPIEFITVLDDATISITDLYYDSGAKAFYVEIENTGPVEAYVNAEVLDVWVNGQLITIGGDKIILVKPGKSGKIKASVELAEEDINHRLNQEIEVKAFFGQREGALVKVLKATFALRVKKADLTQYLLIVVVVILLLLIFFKSKKCNACKHRNAIHKKNCAKCGAKL
ncbi:hypothetical protein ACFLTH_13105 [Bacteroidota bacterium]